MFPTLLLSLPQGKVVVHGVPPYALAWPSNHIAVAGCDKKLVIYTPEGTVSQQFDYFRDSTEKEFTVMCCSPSGQALCVGSYDRIRVFRYPSINYASKLLTNFYPASSI